MKPRAGRTPIRRSGGRVYSTPPATPRGRTRMRVTGNIANPGRFARNLAETAFNRYAPLPLRAAVGIGRLAYSAYRAYPFNGRARAIRRRGTGTGRKYTQGKLGGRFGKTYRPGTDMFRKQGFMHTTEVHGTVNDPDCVYIGHSSFSGTQLLEVICQAILRKLFAKANWNCRDVNENLPSFSDSNVSNLWRLRLIRQDKTTGTLYEHSYTTTGDTSIYLIVGDVSVGLAPAWPQLLEYLRDYMRGDRNPSVFNAIVPYKIVLYREEGNVAVFYQHEAELYFSEMMVTVKSKSTMKIQNRTTAADGSTSDEDISANPIAGLQYEFSGGCPRPNGLSNMFPFEKMLDPSGVISVRANAVTNGNFTKEPLPPKTFVNVVKSGKIKLEPGEIKYSNIYYVTQKPLLKFLFQMGFSLNAGSTANIHMVGKSALFALEDVINVNSSHNINIAYEINREFGAFISVKKDTIAQGRRYDIEHNDVPVSS